MPDLDELARLIDRAYELALRRLWQPPADPLLYRREIAEELFLRLRAATGRGDR